MDKSLIILLLLASVTCAQPAEIREQTVRYGDNILQYAVVQTVTGATTYYNYCSDCTCLLTVKTLDTSETVFTNRGMQDLGDGLFGSPATGELLAEQRYRATSTCTSAVYGVGQAESLFSILPSNISAGTSGNINTNDNNLVNQVFDWKLLLDPLAGIKGAIIDTVTRAAEKIVEAIAKAFPQVNEIFKNIPSINQIMWIIQFVIGLVTNPFKTIMNLILYVIIDFWVKNWEAIILMMLMPFMLLEVAFLGFSVLMTDDNSDILQMLYSFLHLHVQLAKLLYEIISVLLYLAMTLIQTISKMLTTPKEATPLM